MTARPGDQVTTAARPGDQATAEPDPATTAPDPTTAAPMGPAATGLRAAPAGLASWVRSAEFADAVVATVGIRLVLLVAAPVAVILFGDAATRARIPFELWNAWDSPHYIEVATVGYRDPARAVLFPLLPVLLRAGSIVVPPLVAGLVISALASVAAAVAIYRLARLDGGDRRVARGAVLAMNVFPTSFALVPPYTEAIFLALASWTFLQARRGRWGGAGILGFLAASTRLPGVLLLPAVLPSLRGFRRSPRMLALLVVLGGPLLYLGVNWTAYGDPLFFLRVQHEVFHVDTVAPWTALGSLFTSVGAPRADPNWLTVYLAPLLALVALAATFAWCLVRLRHRVGYAVYSGISLLMFASISWPISVPRYILGVFPMFLMLGGLARSRLGTAVLVGSSVLLGLLTAEFALGRWAF